MRLVAIALLVGCNAPPARQVPGASLTPVMRMRSVDACGMDSSWSAGPIDLRYDFTYDALGRLAHARGTYTRGGPEELIEYSWDNLDHMVSVVEMRGTTRYTT